MKFTQKILSVVLVGVMLASAFSAFAVNPAKEIEDFDDEGFLFSSDLFEGINNHQISKVQITPKSGQVNLGASAELTVRRGECSDPQKEDYKYNDCKGYFSFLYDEDPEMVCLREDALRDKDGKAAKDGNVVVDVIYKLADTASIKNIMVMSHANSTIQCIGWYALYASMNFEDLDKPSSKIVEFKNIKSESGGKTNNFQKLSLKEGETAPFANYVMLRIYWGLQFSTVNTEPNYTLGTDYVHHETRIVLSEFSVFGKPHTHSYEQTDYKAPTCAAAGSKTEYCPVCTNVKTTKINPLPHKNKTTTTAATYFAAGKKVTKCSVCGKTVTTKLAKKTLKKPTAKLTAAKKALKVKVNKVTGQTGFQIRYRLKGKSKWTTKTYTGKKTVTKKLKLKQKKNYQVQVRAMVKSGSKKAYSSWSKTYTKKTK